MLTTPGVSNLCGLPGPFLYRPRSKVLPGVREKRLWAIGSSLGKLIVAPAGTATTCGRKVLLRVVMVNVGAVRREGLAATGSSQIRVSFLTGFWPRLVRNMTWPLTTAAPSSPARRTPRPAAARNRFMGFAPGAG